MPKRISHPSTAKHRTEGISTFSGGVKTHLSKADLLTFLVSYLWSMFSTGPKRLTLNFWVPKGQLRKGWGIPRRTQPNESSSAELKPCRIWMTLAWAMGKKRTAHRRRLDEQNRRALKKESLQDMFCKVIPPPPKLVAFLQVFLQNHTKQGMPSKKLTHRWRRQLSTGLVQPGEFEGLQRQTLQWMKQNPFRTT